MIRWATEIKLPAERRVGEMVREVAERKERQTKGRPGKNGTGRAHLPKLRDLGLSQRQSKDWQALAAIPEPEFERPGSSAAPGTPGGHVQGQGRYADGHHDQGDPDQGRALRERHTVCRGNLAPGRLGGHPSRPISLALVTERPGRRPALAGRTQRPAQKPSRTAPGPWPRQARPPVTRAAPFAGPSCAQDCATPRFPRFARIARCPPLR